MKWAGLLLLWILLAVSPVESQVPDDNIIVPGQRIGRWRLSMTIADLVQANGAPDSVIPGGGARDLVHENLLLHRWTRLAFYAMTSTNDRQKIEFLISVSSDHKTDKAIAANSRRDAVEAAYGPATAVTQWAAAPGSDRLIYDAIGLVARFAPGGLADSLLVFRSVTAKEFWRF